MDNDVEISQSRVSTRSRSQSVKQVPNLNIGPEEIPLFMGFRLLSRSRGY